MSLIEIARDCHLVHLQPSEDAIQEILTLYAMDEILLALETCSRSGEGAQEEDGEENLLCELIEKISKSAVAKTQISNFIQNENRCKNVLKGGKAQNASVRVKKMCAYVFSNAIETEDDARFAIEVILSDSCDDAIVCVLERAVITFANENVDLRVKEFVLEVVERAKRERMESSLTAEMYTRALNLVAKIDANAEDYERDFGKEMDAFEESLRVSKEKGDVLLLSVTLESLGEFCENNRAAAMLAFRRETVREMLFSSDDEVKHEEESVRISSLACAARICGSAAAGHHLNNDLALAEKDKIIFERYAQIFVQKAVDTCTNCTGDEATSAADALGIFALSLASTAEDETHISIIQTLLLEALEILAHRSFHKSCVASIHALANVANSLGEDGSKFETQLRIDCYSASSYRGTPAEAISKSLSSNSGDRGDEGVTQKRIALYRLAQSLGARAWFARDCLMSSSTDALIGTQRVNTEPSTESMRWRVSALKGIAKGAAKAMEFDLIDENSYIRIKSASEINPFLGGNSLTGKLIAIPDVATMTL